MTRKIVVVAQTPPPYNGQSIMNELLLSHKFDNTELIHVRMAFSNQNDDIGRFQIHKLWHLVSVITRIFYVRLRYRPIALYYPPAGPNRIPMYRDMVILICTRWLFKYTIFHFHAGGVSKLYPKLSTFTRALYKRAYFYPEISIILSKLNPRDDIFFHSTRTYVVPNGVKCVAAHYAPKDTTDRLLNILSVGLMCESKGTLVLIESLGLLAKEKIRFKATFVGNFQSHEFKTRCYEYAASLGILDKICFKGSLAGDEKWNEYKNADIFCFPTFYESETFGLVLLEAMQYSLPIIASSWRGVPDIIEDQESGLLIEPRSSANLASRLLYLIENPDVRSLLGKNAQTRFQKHFTEQIFKEKMQNVFENLP